MKLQLSAKEAIALYGMLCAVNASSDEGLKTLHDRLYVSLVTIVHHDEASEASEASEARSHISLYAAFEEWFRQQQLKVDVLSKEETTPVTLFRNGELPPVSGSIDR